VKRWERQTAVLGAGVKLPLTKAWISEAGIDSELALMEV